MKNPLNYILIVVALFFINSPIRAKEKAHIDAFKSKAVSKSLALVYSLEIPTTKKITGQIVQEKFVELEKLSEKFESEFKENPIYESQILKLYRAVDDADEKLLEKLNKWVQLRPTYVSLGFRGMYKADRGFKLRGVEYINNTPPENLIKMKKMHEEAKLDLLEALQKNSKFIPGYVGLILIDKAIGNTEGIKKSLDKAIKEIPSTYYIRYEYLNTLTPRWGGSFEQMAEYLNTLTEKEYSLNPRIWSLNAESLAEHGLIAWNDKKYDEGIKFYSEALKYGARLEFLKNRGYMYFLTKQYGLAMTDYEDYKKYKENDETVNGYIEQLKQLIAKPK